MKNYFITAPGTGIGKTLITCALAYQLQRKGKRVRAIKPVISGFNANLAAESDTGLLLAAQGIALSSHTIDAVSPWRFAAPLSPDMATEEEGSTINFTQLVEFCRQHNDAEYVLIEGAGGVMTPLDNGHTMLDLATNLGYPVILVAGSYLGSLSHTLTSANAIASAGLALHAVIISESASSAVPPLRIMKTLRCFLPHELPVCCIPRLDSSLQLWKYVPDLIDDLRV